MVGRSFAEIRRKGYFCLAILTQKGQIGLHKSHHSGKPTYTLLSRPIRSIGLRIRLPFSPQDGVNDGTEAETFW